MTTGDVMLLKEIRERLNESEKKLSDYTEISHNESKENITDNEDAILEASVIGSDNEAAILELSEMVSKLENRIAALEGGKS